MADSGIFRDVREKKQEPERPAPLGAPGLGLGPRIDPADRPRTVLSSEPTEPLPVRRIIWQSTLTAVLLTGLGIASWFFIIGPLFERQTEELRVRGEAIQASLQRVTDQMRLEQSRLKTETDALDARSLELSNQVTALEERLLDLSREAEVRQLERDRLEAEITAFNDSTQGVRDRNASLKLENEVLQTSIDELTAQEENLINNVARENFANIQIIAKNKVLSAENARLIAEMDEQRAALEELSARLLTIAEDVDAQRKQLLDKAAKVEEARQEFVAGLEDLAAEYAKIAGRNYGAVRLRYAAFARDVRLQVTEVNDLSIDLSFGEESAEDVRKQVEAYLTSSLVLGKSAQIRYLPDLRETAEQVREALSGAGVTATLSPIGESDVGDRINEIGYFDVDDETAAEQVQSLLQEGAQISMDLVKEEATVPVNFILWVVAEAEAPPEEQDDIQAEPDGPSVPGEDETFPPDEQAPAPPAQPIPSVERQGEDIPEIPDEGPPDEGPPGEAPRSPDEPVFEENPPDEPIFQDDTPNGPDEPIFEEDDPERPPEPPQ